MIRLVFFLIAFWHNFITINAHNAGQQNNQTPPGFVLREKWLVYSFGRKICRLNQEWSSNAISIYSSGNDIKFYFSKQFGKVGLFRKYDSKIDNSGIIQVRFEIWCTDTSLLRGASIVSVTNNSQNEVLRFTDPIKRKIITNNWSKISFEFSVQNVGKNDLFGIEFTNYGSTLGHVIIRQVDVSLKDPILSENLIRNGDFEQYYYFPVGFMRLFISPIPYWNEINGPESTMEEKVVIGINEDTYSSSVMLVSDYDDHYTDYFVGKNGHFAAEIPNEYVYDSISVSENKSINTSYLQAELDHPLIKDKTYRLSIDIMLSPYSRLGDNSFGGKFSQDRYNPSKDVDLYSSDRPIPKPDINFFEQPLMNDSTWTTFSTVYTAKGGESFLTFGMFSNQSHIQIDKIYNERTKNKYSSIYLIDNISLVEM